MTHTKRCQWHILRSDPWLLSSLTWLPILLGVTIWWIFSQGIARDLPIAVVDLQQSTLSRELVRTVDATPSLQVAYRFTDIQAAQTAMVGSDIYAYMVIPENFERDIYLQHPPRVTVFYNSQYVLIGKLVNSAIVQAHGTFNAKLGVRQQLSHGDTTMLAAAGKTLAIGTQITPLFNKNSNYAQFLVPAIVPAIWQIAIIVATILFLTANHRVYGLAKMVGKKPLWQLLSMGSFYLPFFVLQGTAFLLCFYYWLAWPMEGSFVTIIFAQTITAIASMCMGALFFFLTLDPARAMSFAGAFSAPSFAFMGVTFPVTDMNQFATLWRSLLPVSHYIEAQISQVSYGASTWKTLSDFMPAMCVYLLPLLLAVALIKKHLAKRDDQHASD